MFKNLIKPVINGAAIFEKQALQKCALRSVSYGGHGPVATMDDCPVPQGSWDTNYSAKQTKYNMHLAFGILFTGFTLIVAKTSGLVYLHATLPPLPKE